MAKISGKICSSHCSKVTCPVPVLPTSHPLSRHGLGLGEVKEKGVEDEGEGGYGLASSSLSPSHLTCFCFVLFCVIFSLGIRITRKKTRSTTTQMASMRMDGTQLRQRLKSSLIEYLHRGRSSYLAGKTLQGRGTRDSAN